MNWLYENKEITKLSQTPKDAVGFIYKIVNTKTGEYYIGKKHLASRRKRKFGKKEIAKITDKRLKHYEMVVKESNWLTYRSSNKDVSKWKDSSVELTILRFCTTKKGLTYYEADYRFKYNVLGDELSKNDNISGNFFRKDLEL